MVIQSIAQIFVSLSSHFGLGLGLLRDQDHCQTAEKKLEHELDIRAQK